MKELSIVYQSANYNIKYEYKDTTRFSRLLRHKIGSVDYAVFFDDARLIDIFGNPFEFFTMENPDFQIHTYDKSTPASQMANIIIEKIGKMESI